MTDSSAMIIMLPLLAQDERRHWEHREHATVEHLCRLDQRINRIGARWEPGKIEDTGLDTGIVTDRLA